MKYNKNLITGPAICGVILALAVSARAQDPGQMQPAPIAASQAAGTTVPRLVSFSGMVKDSAGKPVTGPLSITFSLFAEQEGGTTLWSETQTVEADAQGHYSVFLGATNAQGLPLEIFATGAARWLAIEPGVPAAAELPRVLLVGVPYALKAADADTLGGKPASAFVTAGSEAAQATASTAPGAAITAVPGVTPATTITGSGTTDYVPLWTSSTNLGDSILFQGSGLIEVLGTLELPAAGTATTSAGYDSRPLDLFASAYNSSSKAAVAEHFRWEAEPVSNGTSSPSGKLDLLYGSGTATPTETGLSINSKGLLTFASGQAFPGTGPGTITGVTAGTDLTGGGTSGKVTLNLDTTKVPILNASNSFFGNQSVTGNISATGAIYSNGNISTSGSFNANGSGYFTNVYAYQSANSYGAYGIFGVGAGTGELTFGVEGFTASLSGVGVYGHLVGASNTGTDRAGVGVWGDTNQSGRTAVQGTADDGYAGVFLNNASDAVTLYVENDSSSSGFLFSAFAPANGGAECYIDDSANLYCSGSKSAVVPVDSGARKVALYAMEAPENWFEDAGSGQLTGGAATINLEPTFAQTVNTGIEYHVFLTPEGDCKGLYVANKTSQEFEVRELGGGQSNIAFDYRIMAKRKGYETIRLPDKTKQMDGMRLQHRKTAGAQKPLTASASPR